MFADSVADKSLAVADLKPFRLDDLLAKYLGWAPGMKHGACRAVMRALRWAKLKRYIDINPLADCEKPRPGKRNVVLKPAEYEKLLSLAGNRNFKDLLEVTWETACRPQESLAIEARHVDLANAR